MQCESLCVSYLITGLFVNWLFRVRCAHTFSKEEKKKNKYLTPKMYWFRNKMQANLYTRQMFIRGLGFSFVLLLRVRATIIRN